MGIQIKFLCENDNFENLNKKMGILEIVDNNKKMKFLRFTHFWFTNGNFGNFNSKNIRQETNAFDNVSTEFRTILFFSRKIS